MEDPFVIIPPKGNPVPMIVSVPHCGTEFPEKFIGNYKGDMIISPDDTDWYVHDLYNFASDMGITIIHARYSRWVIDLNRDPDSKPLYDDGRIITSLTPTTDFFGTPIYKSWHYEPHEDDIQFKLENYYWPYYKKIQELLDERKNQFGKVLLWDAHSIRHHVPTIREEVFPDMILGNNDKKSADLEYIDVALSGLSSGIYQVNHNDPFKGGHITRYFGKPEDNVHALQLEMNKILYMDDDEEEFDELRANMVRNVLKKTFTGLIESLIH